MNTDIETRSQNSYVLYGGYGGSLRRGTQLPVRRNATSSRTKPPGRRALTRVQYLHLALVYSINSPILALLTQFPDILKPFNILYHVFFSLMPSVASLTCSCNFTTIPTLLNCFKIFTKFWFINSSNIKKGRSKRRKWYINEQL